MIAGDDPSYIGVDHCRSLAKCDRGYGCCSICAETGQLAQLRLGARESATPGDLPSTGDQIAGPGIISEPGPLTQHVIVVSHGQFLDSRPALNETAEAWPDASHGCLLQHDFAQPYRAGVRRRAS